jgi:ATP-dependent DNA helicase RecG
MPDFLSNKIEYLKGVGPQRADLLKKELEVFSYADLLTHYPFRYVDRSRIHTIRDLNAPDLTYIQLKGTITAFRKIGSDKAGRLVATFRDGSGSIELVWFKGISWVLQAYKLGVTYLVFGRPTNFAGKWNMVHPEIELEEAGANAARIFPVYNVTEKLKAKNTDSRALMKVLMNLVSEPGFSIPETLPSPLLSRLKLMPRQQAMRQVHFPETFALLDSARQRIKFEELFYIQLKMLLLKTTRKQQSKGYVFGKVGEYFNRFYQEKLPFQLTGAQKKVIKEIRFDTGSGKQMNRLLQGDVGSGKTIVALMIMLLAIDNGFQACLMAPTEILAGQHFESISELLQGMDVNIRLLKGSTSAKERRLICQELESGTLNILIGTHAVIEDNVKFSNLGLVIIDEQHRFGVEQRARMWTKNLLPPHILVMTATPIPRTLAMTLYGDLDCSVIDELPAGRKPIQTLHRYENNRLRVFGFLREQIELGRQIYIVYPLIEESETLDYLNLMEGYEAITRAFPMPGYQVSIVHGKMKSADKDYEMMRFKKGETQIMVATTVIEVGVNIPNASVMIIESAERFGLSQLHQLRGRVGRGAEQSYCILMSSYKLSADARIRLETMVKTSDGFEIADTDLKLRGPGDLEGTRQSGILDLKLADLGKDQQILLAARHAAEEIIAEDPLLVQPHHQVIKDQLNHKKATHSLSRIS